MKFRSLTMALIGLSCSIAVMGQIDVQKRLQNRFIMAEDGDTIHIEAGKFQLNNSLWLDGKKNIVIKGAGQEQTILSFKGQTAGAEGIKITDAEHITLQDLSVQDTKGDAVKAQHVKGISFYRVTTEWTGKPGPKNGAYGLYPVQCSHVLVDYCKARGASDAGIYVGQSKHIVVRNSIATENVAGIEIENSLYADVYDNEAYGNTGGILVFDLPNLVQKKGGQVRVYNNNIYDNNHSNFAPKGNIVGKVAKGTGILILATSGVEIFENEIKNNRTMGLGIISYYVTENPMNDSLYYPFPQKIHIHHNEFERKPIRATMEGRMGKMFRFKLKFGRNVPHIIWDGIRDDKWAEDQKILCIHNNKNGSFAEVDAAHDFKNIDRNMKKYNCQLTELPEAKISQLEKE